MLVDSKKFLAVIIVLIVGLSAGVGYTVNSNFFSETEPNVVKSQFLSSDLEREKKPTVGEGILGELARGNSEFALDLYQKIRDREGNLFYSPYSISLALAMTYAGAEGETEEQMAETLRFTLPEEELHRAFNALDMNLSEDVDDNFVLNVANSFWGQKNYHFEEEYLDLLARNYGTGVRILDFVKEPEISRQLINGWVENRTEEKIKDLIPKGSIDSSTRAVLTNAIYFNASWKNPFEEKDTKEGKFALIGGKDVSVEMMSNTDSFLYARGEDYKAIELSYEGDSTSMLIIMPSEGKFSQFEKILDMTKIDEINDELQMSEVSLKMPKFEFEKTLNLTEILPGMGMTKAFGTEADFSGMTGNKALSISEVLHKAFISVDEEGTEAAAATAVVMKETAVVEIIDLTLDHPFIFLIKDDETSNPLFLGRVLDPTE